jgi:hypothetical protein
MKIILRVYLVLQVIAAPLLVSAQGDGHADSLARALAPAKQNEKLKSELDQKLHRLDRQAVSLNLSIEDAAGFQPGAGGGGLVYPDQRWVNTVAVRGTVGFFGIPLNLNYSNAHTVIPSLTQTTSGLFKFDFDPNTLSNAFKSDLEHYYDLRKTAFGGQDLTGYTRMAVMKQLQAQEAAVHGSLENHALANYLNDPAAVNALLQMNEAQIRQRLTAVAQQQKPKTPQLGELGQAAQQKAVLNATAEKALAGDPVLQQYLSDPVRRAELKEMSSAQVAQRIRSLAALSQTPQTAEIPDLCPILGLDLSAYIRNTMMEQSLARDRAISQLAGSLAGSGTPASPGSPKSLTDARQTDREIDSVARTITHIQATLQKNGLDLGKMQQIQRVLDSGNGQVPATEFASALKDRKPGSGLQSLFSHVQDLKIGSFGNQLPGQTQGQDVFMQGSHITYKLGDIPVSAGYGSANDLVAAKDALYQSSIYSAPKTMTYLGAQLNKRGFGKVKISVISSFGSDQGSSSYAVPSVSSNSVAFTVSKDMTMGKLGELYVDVSKSSTLYNNNYQIGSDILLAQKAGVNVNLPNDLFNAVAFDLNHHVEIKPLEMTETLYFNYAGTGYENAGNNGYGGARKKLGGSLRKAFAKNKLTLNLRTDLGSQPISYTSDDQWKTYALTLDSRYAVSRKFSLDLSYSANGTSKQVAGVSTPVYSFGKFQAEGNLSYKIGKNFTVSHFSISKQDYSNELATSAMNPAVLSSLNSSMLTAAYTQSTVMGRNSLTASVFYNKELSTGSLIGNLLNADMSYQYLLLNKLSMASGLTYLDNAGTARQAGIRQTLQLFTSKSFEMNTYLDIRQNLITPVYADLYPACRAELSLKYHLTK